jgi:flagellar biosynthetic protein FliO
MKEIGPRFRVQSRLGPVSLRFLAVLWIGLLGLSAVSGYAEGPADQPVRKGAGEEWPILADRPSRPAARPETAAPLGGLLDLGRLLRVGLALGLVLLLMGGLFALMRRLQSTAGSKGREGMLEFLVRTSVGPKQSLLLVRLGSRVLLLGVTAERIQTLQVIRDPEEVERLGVPEASSTGRFQELLGGMRAAFGGEPRRRKDSEKTGVEEEIRKEMASLKEQVSKWSDAADARDRT